MTAPPKDITMSFKDFDSLMFLANEMAKVLDQICLAAGDGAFPELKAWNDFLDKALMKQAPSQTDTPI